MRMLWMMAGILAVSQGARCAQAPPEIPASQLVREVAYNELHDHTQHGYWRYWIEHHVLKETRQEEQVETADGPVKRLILSNGRPPTVDVQQQEQERLNHLLSSPQEKAAQRQEYTDDEERIGRIIALLPNAFLFDYSGEENGCYRLRFRPNPDYPARSIEERIFHAMTGELWINARFKRLARLDGQLQENLNFGFGFLGHLNKGGWFRLERTQVSPTDWKTERLELHLSGRALLFKSIARETSEVRGGFVSVPARMSLAQGMTLLEQPEVSSVTVPRALVAPAVFAARR